MSQPLPGQTTPAAWFAGAAEVDITPVGSLFLYGYPHVKRQSRGVHDPLLASALYLEARATPQLHKPASEAGVLFVACDVIFIPAALAGRARARIAEATGLQADRVMVTATHTHSGPLTTALLSNEADPVIPPPDPRYLDHLEQQIVQAAVQACLSARPAVVSFAEVAEPGLGTNRHDPAGPRIPTIPVLVAHDAEHNTPVAVMCVVSMHPTVLHEDWTLFSGDFPGLARQWLQRNAVGPDCPLVYHMGASGNQSPRHVVKSNTIEEATRLGELLGRALAEGITQARPLKHPRVDVRSAAVDLPVRTFPSVDAARAAVDRAAARLAALRNEGAPRAAIRTAECDWFGAEETLTLAGAAAADRLRAAVEACQPAPVQAVRIGEHIFVGWPGEVFVEFAISVMQRHPEASIITLANAELQGYLVTREAVERGAYEAGNALFASPVSGERLVDTTLRLLADLQPLERPACPTS